MIQAFDYNELMAKINDKMDEKMGYSAFPQGSQGEAEEYPFFTYEIINAHMGIGATDNVSGEVFEMLIEYDAHVSDVASSDDDMFAGSTGAATLANNLRKFFTISDISNWAFLNGFPIIDISDVTDTTNIISMQVERSAGFQVRLRIKDTFKDEKEYITQ
ncbi:hypothetical protein M2S00_06685 [Apilactobacillus sp. TMW 2.2459]|uniref:phage neck terminator protein n=1 Tax=Apilactobacillus xinyiensis TaxID=2841032 RepID=UPI00200FF7D3|nr:hypothetical protein [Apilactobacillus xinyiensis]MCL0312790.1 hypothetical protein [Apilactobacillus xinyiensis]